MAKDHYQILGVSPNAPQEEIDEAYNALLEKYNPDHYLDPEQKGAAIRAGLEVRTAYRKVMEQRRQPFDMAGQMPQDRTWAMQRGAPFWAPPAQPGEDVVIFKPEQRGETGLTKRPTGWGEWLAAVAVAAFGSLPLLIGVVGIGFFLSWAIREGISRTGEWLLLVGVFVVGAGLIFLGAVPTYRVWLLLTRLRPRRRPGTFR